MLNVPWTREFLSVHSFQMVTSLSRVVNDAVRPFPRRAQLPLSRVFSCCSDFAKDEVPYVQSPEFNPLVVVLGHLFLILCHSTGRVVSYFIQAVQVEPQFIVIESFSESSSSDACYSNLYCDYCLCAIGKLEGCLSCWGSGCGPVSPQDTR